MEDKRNLGQQPIAQLMLDRGLSPRDLVRASPQQLTHKTVARAIKGRRLTANSMNQVLEALNRASSQSFGLADLFNYSELPGIRVVDPRTSTESAKTCIEPIKQVLHARESRP